VVSCWLTDNDSYKKLGEDTFAFKIDVKDIGRCPSDHFPTKRRLPAISLVRKTKNKH